MSESARVTSIDAIKDFQEGLSSFCEEAKQALLAIDMDHDLIACAQIDTLDVVPELDIEAWRICALA